MSDALDRRIRELRASITPALTVRETRERTRQLMALERQRGRREPPAGEVPEFQELASLDETVKDFADTAAHYYSLVSNVTRLLEECLNDDTVAIAAEREYTDAKDAVDAELRRCRTRYQLRQLTSTEIVVCVTNLSRLVNAYERRQQSVYQRIRDKCRKTPVQRAIASASRQAAIESHESSVGAASRGVASVLGHTLRLATRGVVEVTKVAAPLAAAGVYAVIESTFVGGAQLAIEMTRPDAIEAPPERRQIEAPPRLQIEGKPVDDATNSALAPVYSFTNYFFNVNVRNGVDPNALDGADLLTLSASQSALNDLSPHTEPVRAPIVEEVDDDDDVRAVTQQLGNVAIASNVDDTTLGRAVIVADRSMHSMTLRPRKK